MAKLPRWLYLLKPTWREAGAFILGGALVYGLETYFHPHQLPEAYAGAFSDPRWYSAAGTWTGVILALVGFTRWQTKHRHEKIAAARPRRHAGCLRILQLRGKPG
jgi:hypothetical protein